MRRLVAGSDSKPRVNLLVAILAVEADRVNRLTLNRAERNCLDAERRWRKDVHPGQLALDGIEPARCIAAGAITHRQRLVLAVRVRARNRCEDCGRSDAARHFDIHHLTYERHGHEDPDDVLWLCRDCHDLRHDLVGGHPPPA